MGGGHGLGGRRGKTYTIQKFVVGSIRLDSLLLTNGSIMDSYYKILE